MKIHANRDNRKIAIAEMADEYLSATEPLVKWKKSECPVCKGFGCNVCKEMGVVFFSPNFGSVRILNTAFIEMLLNWQR